MQSYIDSLDDSITELNLYDKQLTCLPDLSKFKQLTKLDCGYNQITELNNLPNSITILYCSNNQITELNNLANSITTLDCYNNQITELNNLANSITTLHCYNNQITELNNLPNSITYLDCNSNQITELNNLPNSITTLNCSYNQITELNNLPNSITELYCLNNQLVSNDLIYWKGIKKFRKFYYTLKFGNKLERMYIKHRNASINLELLYTPSTGFYKQFWSEDSIKHLDIIK
jgi:Leucine-rich repeat (LRR) protein